MLKDSAILHTESCFARPLPYARIPSNLAAAGLITEILRPIYEYGVGVAANVQRAPLDMTASPPVSVMVIGTPRRIHKFRPCWTKPLGFSTTWVFHLAVLDHAASSNGLGMHRSEICALFSREVPERIPGNNLV